METTLCSARHKVDAHYKLVLLAGLPCLLIIRMLTSERKYPLCQPFYYFSIQFNRLLYDTLRGPGKKMNQIESLLSRIL